ncbi:MAG: hypothetical protein GAK45_00085 [Pseudomonas citronellolis]|nr:MAG: hypothetical protein GAK45_00085 [Pseudomonas citronellolis]
MPPALRPWVLLACGLALISAAQAEPGHAECIAPASPGGAFDLTCQLARRGLLDAGLSSAPLSIRYQPGGVGAVAYNAVIAEHASDGDTLTAFSSGSLLNLAQGKFGRYDEQAVKWLAAIGTSYGALAVRADSPYHSLADLVAAMKAAPDQVLIGAAGTLGSQDWMQVALLARAAGIDPAQLRYVALEGGGEITTALRGGQIQVASSDIVDALPHARSGELRILAVFAPQRLSVAGLGAIPSAREQGFDIVWPVVRGFYMGPNVSEQDYRRWQQRFERLLASPGFARQREASELYPFALTGSTLETYVHQQVQHYRELARDFGLIR